MIGITSPLVLYYIIYKLFFNGILFLVLNILCLLSLQLQDTSKEVVLEIIERYVCIVQGNI